MADLRINRTQSAGRAAASRSTKRTQASDPNAFASHLDRVTEATIAPPVTDPAGVSLATAILAAQEMPPEGESGSRRQLVRRGADILDSLDEIRLDILKGGVPRYRLENLKRLLQVRRGTVNDPQLIDIIKDIELRAEVELAKLNSIR